MDGEQSLQSRLREMAFALAASPTKAVMEKPKTRAEAEAAMKAEMEADAVGPVKVRIGIMHLLAPGRTYIPMLNGAPGNGVQYTGDLPAFLDEFGFAAAPLVCRMAERESTDVKYETRDGHDVAVRIVERFLTLRD